MMLAVYTCMHVDGSVLVTEFEWGFYALSASKAIFRARTYNCITFSVRWYDYLMNETRRKPTTGRQYRAVAGGGGGLGGPKTPPPPLGQRLHGV